MTIDRASDNPFPSVLFVEGDPEALAANPPAGQQRLAVGTDHLLYLVDDAGAATLVGAAVADILDLTTAETDDTLVLAPDGAGGVEFRAETAGASVMLGVNSYAGNASNVQTSATLGDADATNMKVTFTAPGSGNVLVRLTGVARMASGAAAGSRGYWGLRESTTIIAGPTYVVDAISSPGHIVLVSTSVVYVLTGLSAGSHTYKWAVAGDGTASAGVLHDSANPSVMEVWELA